MAVSKKIKKRWIKALRSGQYKKTTGYLRTGAGYCCLGVLCDLHSKETKTPWDGESMYMGKTGGLPIEVGTWLGLTPEETRSVCANGVSLVGANDAGKSFTEIASLIEEGL